eukprot:COSAG04_NODE_2716_length_3693_cov_2.258208_6_plen_247_part_01
MGFGAQMDVLTSREFKVCGAIGPCASLNKKTSYVAETEIGVGNTSAWRMCTLDQKTTVALYFECTNQQGASIPPGSMRHFQFITRYQHPTGEYRMRVTTLAYPWASQASGGGQGGAAAGPNLQELANGFDQEAAAVLMARYATHKTHTEESFEILRWLDRMLIRLCTKFGEFKEKEVASFRLNMRMSIYPQFMSHRTWIFSSPSVSSTPITVPTRPPSTALGPRMGSRSTAPSSSHRAPCSISAPSA